MRRLSILLALALVVSSCSTGSERDRPLVVVSTTILGDVVGEVVGPEVEVAVLFPVGADPHDFAPSASDAALLRQADLVVINGLGLEEAMADALASARSDGVTLLEIAPLVDPVLLPSGDPDPHVWLDPSRMVAALEPIVAAVRPFHPDPDALDARAADYRGRLAAAAAEADELLMGVEQRLLVSGHDSLRHFADRFDFEVLGTAIPSGSTAAQPSPSHLAALAGEMRRLEITVIFFEVGDRPDAVHALATESGAVAVPLYVGSLGPEGSGAETYLGLIVTNARIVAEHLGE